MESHLIAAKFSTLLENLKIDPTQAIVANQFKVVTRQINLDFGGLIQKQRIADWWDRMVGIPRLEG